MPEPIEYRAILNLQAALQAISIAGGYHYDVTAAAVKLDPDVSPETLVQPGAPQPAIFIEFNPEEWDYHPSMRVSLEMPLQIHWVADSTPTVDSSKLQVFMRGCADVEKAIAVDITRGGLAKDTRITGRAIGVLQGGRVWALIDVMVSIKRGYGQPNG